MKDKIRTSKTNAQARAFSLIEILMALAITGIVMTTIYVTYSSSLAIINDTSKRALDSRKHNILFKIIQSDIQNAYYPQDPQKRFFQAVQNDSAGMATDRLDLITLVPGLSLVSKVGDLREVSYFMKESGISPLGVTMFNLYRREQVGIDEELDRGGLVSKIADNVVSFRVECAGRPETLKWERKWDYRDQLRYPLGVKVTIQFPSFNDPDKFVQLEVVGQIKQDRPS